LRAAIPGPSSEPGIPKRTRGWDTRPTGVIVKATILDLRYKTKEILKALEAREPVTITYHGKVKGVIMPVQPDKRKTVKEDPFFGSARDDKRPVNKLIRDMRKPRRFDI
jgi:prevent-host-death family protein